MRAARKHLARVDRFQVFKLLRVPFGSDFKIECSGRAGFEEQKTNPKVKILDQGFEYRVG